MSSFETMAIRYLLAPLVVGLIGLAAFWIERRIEIETEINSIITRELQDRCDQLKIELSVTKSELSSVTNYTKMLEDSLKEQQNNQDKRHEDIQKLIHHGLLRNEEIVKRGKIPRSSDSVGFTTRSVFQTTENGQVLIFSNVLTNHGNGYNETTGQFTCTQPGLYFFQLSILSLTNNALAHIVKNGEFSVYAFTTSKSDNNWQSGSASLVTRLNIGDAVWVVSGSNATFDHQSHLSGLLISP